MTLTCKDSYRLESLALNFPGQKVKQKLALWPVTYTGTQVPYADVGGIIPELGIGFKILMMSKLISTLCRVWLINYITKKERERRRKQGGRRRKGRGSERARGENYPEATWAFASFWPYLGSRVIFLTVHWNLLEVHAWGVPYSEGRE